MSVTRVKTKSRDTHPPHGMPAGLLVLGMHRSGTSALARVLGLCGANLGTRQVAGSLGNEEGHWEDAFAVELHDRLLAAFGANWDDPLALPEDWRESEAGRDAVRQIVAYLRQDRVAHPIWAVKDPRLCLFAPAWREAAGTVGMPLSAVLVARHPDEVARSLTVRDGIAHGRGLLLWLEYTITAFAAIDGQPATLLDYPSLLGDWRQALARVSALPGMQALQPDAATATAIDAFLDPGKRHHRDPGEDRLPAPIAAAWDVLRGAAAHGRLDHAAVRSLRVELESLRGLLGPVLAESRQLLHQVWLRAGRAEAVLADQALGMPAKLDALREGIDANRDGLLEAVGGELRRMQEITGHAQEAAAAREREAQLAAELSPRLQQMADGIEANRQGLIDAISIDLRRMQDEVANARVALATEQERSSSAAHANAKLQEQMHAALQTAQSDLADARSHGDRLQATIMELEAAAARMLVQHESDTTANADLATTLHEQRREMAAMRHAIEQLRELELQFESLKGSRSWRWTRPLRVAFRLLRGDLNRSDAAKFWRALRGIAGRAPLLSDGVRAGLMRRSLPGANPHPGDLPDEREAARLHLPVAVPGLPDVFVWSVIDWHFRFQRPQHLAKALANKGHRVFYISNNFVDSPQPGFHVEPLGCEGRLFQVHLNLDGKPPIYFGMPTAEQVEALRGGLGHLLGWSCTMASVSLVQHPYWSQLVRSVPSARLVYDCMDHHGGFENTAGSVIDAEARLIDDADLVIVTSSWLEQQIQPRARATAIIRNAGEFGFFSEVPGKTFTDPRGRQVIGYFGAIAEWFDVELVRKVAKAHADKLVLLVGSDTVDARGKLADLENVQLVGEVPYSELPYWLHGFDVALLPFRIIELTMATNPVKVYEYLAAGKPVVAVDLPEMAQFDGLVRVASDANDFVSAIGELLGACLDPEADTAARAARQAFAAGQTWDHRAREVDDAIARIEEPLVSVVVLTYNNLEFSKNCLFSIEAYSDYRNLEVIVVDNASSDGSPEWFQAWADEASAAGHRRRLILNDANLGFSAGNNVGLKVANGEFLVVLNNDTYVTFGWVRSLCAHLRRDPQLGLVGPVTNNIGNEAKLDIQYDDIIDMHRVAGLYTRAHPGQSLPIRTAAFFCVAIPRPVYEAVGGLDEAFGLGFFEDDDYCRRVAEAGWHVACAEDVFVHHHLSASFNALKAETRQQLFETNKAIYEAKWGPWVPHAYRDAGR